MSRVPTHLDDLPSELLINIYASLPSFFGCFALAATCTRLRSIWHEHTSQIYPTVASTSIPCETYARILLEDQGGSSRTSTKLSIQDIARLARSASVMEKDLKACEEHYIPRLNHLHFLRNKHQPLYEGSLDHPPQFSSPERFRFTRAYYQCWALLELDADERVARIATMRPRQLYYAKDISRIDIPNGIDMSGWYNHKYRTQLCQRFEDRISEIWRAEHKLYPIHPMLEKRDYFQAFEMTWDHWQNDLKSWICRSEFRRGPGPFEEPKVHLWDDELGDEYLIKEW